MAALNRIRSILLAAMALFCALTLSGCIAKTVDELYALPRHSDEYYELHEQDIILVYEGEPHELTNIGTEPAVITWSCAPRTD